MAAGGRNKRKQARCAITMWWIWKWRNDYIFNGMMKDVKEKTDWLHKQYKEVEKAMERNDGQIGKERGDNRRTQPWNPPQRGWIKINSDGSVDKVGHAVSAGVFRNNEADFIGAFARKTGKCTIIEAELWGILTGMEKAWEKGYRKVEVETDCAKAIKLINGEEAYDGPATNIVELCRNMKGRRWEIKLSHIPREQNKVADAMTKRGLDPNEDFRWFDEPPRAILSLLHHDNLGLLGSSNVVRVA